MIQTFTVDEVSEILNRSDRQLRRDIKSGKLRASWRGGRWSITEGDLRAYACEIQADTVIVPPQSRADIVDLIDRHDMRPVSDPLPGSKAYAVILSAPSTELGLLTQGPVKLLPDGQRVDGMYYFKKGGGGDGCDLYMYVLILLDWPEEVPITTVPEGGADND